MISAETNRQSRLIAALAAIYRYMLIEEGLPNLLQGICDRLIDHNLNQTAWIVLIDKHTGSTLTAESGLGAQFSPILNRLKSGSLPPCGARVFGNRSGLVELCTDCSCEACHHTDGKPDGTPVVLSISCRPDLYGFLVSQPPPGVTTDAAERQELAHLSEALSATLHRLISSVESKQKQEELSEIGERFDVALQSSQAGLWDWNIRTGIMYTSPNQKRIVHYDDNIRENGQSPWEGLIHPEDKPLVLKALNDHLAGVSPEYQIEYRVKSEDGQWRWYLDNGKVIERDQQGKPVRMTGSHQDITRQREKDASLAAIQQQLNDTLQGERSFLQSIINGAGDPVIAIDLDFNILLINAAAARIMGVNPEESRYRKCHKIFHQSDVPCIDDRFPCPVRRIRETGEPVTLLHNPLHGNDINNTFELEVSPLRDKDNKLIGIIEVDRDISDRLRIEKELKESRSRLYKLAHHDTLTGLPNRLLFRDRLHQAVAKAQRNKNYVAIMFMDLDKFKLVNDSLGHDIGDKLLIEVSRRLKALCRKSDTVARLGGDEFIFMLDDIHDPKNVTRIAKKIMAALTLPIHIESHTLSISTSIGISIYPLDAEDIDQAIKCADIALYQAKNEGRNGFRFFSPDMFVDEYPVPLLEVQLPDALAAGQLLMEYQPQFDMRTNELVGLEALIRWDHPDHGIIPPREFIPIAEESGMIGAIGKWVLQEVCDQIEAWQLANLQPVPVTVNVTLLQLLDPEFIVQVTQMIRDYNLSPELIELELAESNVTEDLEEIISSLKKISRFGIRLAVDNFGTGDISLDYLERFPLDRLKIDHSLIRNITSNRFMARIVSVIILLANNLGITVLAEGVEHEEQFQFLRELNCSQIQGFLLAKPQSAAEIQFLLRPAS